MKKYKVEITRTSYSTKEFVVEAESAADASEKAEEMAYNEVFSEDDASYSVGSVVEQTTNMIKESVKNELSSLMEEFGCDILTIADFGIKTMDGRLVTHVALNDDNEPALFSGEPNEDKHSEEILVSDEEKENIIAAALVLYS